MKVRAPKARMLSHTGDQEADELIHAVRARAKLEKARRKVGWQLAAATAASRRLLIGNCRIFRTPK